MTPQRRKRGGARPLELSEKLYIKTHGRRGLEFEVVGHSRRSDAGASYAVLMHEPERRATEERVHRHGPRRQPLETTSLAQEILDDFLHFAEEGRDARTAGARANPRSVPLGQRGRRTPVGGECGLRRCCARSIRTSHDIGRRFV